MGQEGLYVVGEGVEGSGLAAVLPHWVAGVVRAVGGVACWRRVVLRLVPGRVHQVRLVVSSRRRVGVRTLCNGGERRPCRKRRCGDLLVAVVHCQCILAVDLQVLSQRGRVGVGLVAPPHPARVRLVCGVDVHVLLPVAGVGEASVAALNFALKRFLTWK